MPSPELIVTRIRAEYREMPGMRLTAQQVQRLCGIEGTLCELVLDWLVETKFLVLRPDGTYARVGEGELPLQRPAQRLAAQGRAV